MLCHNVQSPPAPPSSSPEQPLAIQDNQYCLGLDFGSVYLKAVLVAGDGQVSLSLYRKKDRNDRDALDQFLAGVSRLLPGTRLSIGVTGVAPTLSLNAPVAVVNGIIAIARGVRLGHPGARSIIEIGGHTSKFIVLDTTGNAGEVRDFATNDACAAGTGSFLEKQYRRLHLSVEELSVMSAGSPNDASIAGRCAVFAKSDMIHLQQKGTPVAEIAYGLCMAIGRNAMATLLKGREAERPVVLAGGCARNQGIVRAFAEILAPVGPDQLVSSHWAGLEGALGAAAIARDQNLTALALDDIAILLDSLLGRPSRCPTGFPPLQLPQYNTRLTEPVSIYADSVMGYLGVDVGSVSTDLAVLDAAGELLASVYLPTRGRPVDVLQEGMAVIRERFPGGLQVLGCGVTGSGRYLASRLLGADLVKNEITCQFLGARRFFEKVDTIVEIGGQDSKFISVRNGGISDFVMNKICAAGTGSFLEEQARELGIEIVGDFSTRALAAVSPLDLGARCTVFMETEVVNATLAGVSLEDICAGLAYSIVKNYLEKVVGNRPMGNQIVFQGGVASNDAVVAAFEQVLGRPVHVHPLNRISGAIGAALAARAAMIERSGTRFKGLDPTARPVLTSFECCRCPNRCEVNVIDNAGARAYFGDTCERYTSGAAGETIAGLLPNLAEEYLRRCEAFFQESGETGLRIGLPRASPLMGYLPFWARFFKALGHRPVLSPDTSQDTLALGLRHLAVGVCLPIKLAAGHAHALIDAEVDCVFVPSLVILPGDVPSESYACPYTMAVPFMIDLKNSHRFMSPVISFLDEDSFVEGFNDCHDLLGAARDDLRAAYRLACQAQVEFDEAFRKRSKEAVASGGFRHQFAVLGKPYNIYDAFVNLNLFERLRRMGILAVPQKFLPHPFEGISSDLPWRYSADIYKAAVAVSRGNGFYPIIVSNFSCGPDAFTNRQIEAVLGSKPHLALEFDEHRGEAGLITRLEAFIDQLGAAAGPPDSPAVLLPPPEKVSEIPAERSEIFVPYFADDAFAFSGLFKSKGHNASVLPLPDQRVRALGEEHALGKECHAYAMIAGDLIHLHRNGGGRKLVFYFPGTKIPCLLHEYGKGMQLLLQKLGLTNIRVCSPSGAELYEAFGLEGMERLYLGILAIELLGKSVCEIRPYEQEKGLTDRLHRQNLERIEEAVAGGDVLKSLDEAIHLLSTIPVSKTAERPIVGIAGDIYTKTNPAVNNGLFHWLEDHGLEVWPSPFQIDWVDFGITRRLHQSLSRLKLSELLLSGSIALRRDFHQWRVRRVVGERITRADEPGYLEMRKLTAPYMPNEAHELLFINIAKIVDFARNGVDGIINAICFNCMVGNASAAIIEKIRRDYHDVPIITAVYSGGEDPSRMMGLEAFVHQTRVHHRRLKQ